MSFTRHLARHLDLANLAKIDFSLDFPFCSTLHRFLCVKCHRVSVDRTIYFSFPFFASLCFLCRLALVSNPRFLSFFFFFESSTVNAIECCWHFPLCTRRYYPTDASLTLSMMRLNRCSMERRVDEKGIPCSDRQYKRTVMCEGVEKTERKYKEKENGWKSLLSEGARNWINDFFSGVSAELLTVWPQIRRFSAVLPSLGISRCQLNRWLPRKSKSPRAYCNSVDAEINIQIFWESDARQNNRLRHWLECAAIIFAFDSNLKL